MKTVQLLVPFYKAWNAIIVAIRDILRPNAQIRDVFIAINLDTRFPDALQGPKK
jgi:hypothetical protein